MPFLSQAGAETSGDIARAPSDTTIRQALLHCASSEVIPETHKIPYNRCNQIGHSDDDPDVSGRENRKTMTINRSVRYGKPLLGNFEENALNHRLEPIRTVEGYVAEVKASSQSKQTRPLKSSVQVNFYSAGAGCYPYVGQVPINRRGYRIPRSGTLQVTLFNPNGTLVKLFLLRYDLSDMPANAQTILRQTTFLLPTTNTHFNPLPKNCSIDNLADNNQIKGQTQREQTYGQHIETSSRRCPIGDSTESRRVRYLIQLK